MDISSLYSRFLLSWPTSVRVFSLDSFCPDSFLPSIPALTVPLAYTIVSFAPIVSSWDVLWYEYFQGKRYNIQNEAFVGLLILPLGIGNAGKLNRHISRSLWWSSLFLSVVGAPLSGWISDRIVIHYKSERGYWCPEDRLRACFYGAYFPVTVLASALVTKYMEGTPGLVLNSFIFFLNGVGVRGVILLEPWRNHSCVGRLSVILQ